MTRGRGRGKSFGMSSPAIHVSMPTILMPTIVSPQQGGTTTVETSAQKTYEETFREKTTSQSDIDQWEAYYQTVGGEKKKRIYGLGYEAKTYYEQNLCASSSVAPSVFQSTSTSNMDVFVKEMIHALTNHFLLVIMERVQQVVSPIVNLSPVTPMLLPPTTINEDEVDPLVSSDEGIP
ncbi:uncharacterized protein LOC125863845 [Solanum stenotomum]|uniref:uncharacterized protein LOC125863845 n=1 Tax=Solanum stenotomum TaxID=172797 RepID=UPI0020D04CD2|nr:uncharacterized protein LOC125863845 [Solanum stenotomum]